MLFQRVFPEDWDFIHSKGISVNLLKIHFSYSGENSDPNQLMSEYDTCQISHPNVLYFLSVP
jgi:hypothetical protein